MFNLFFSSFELSSRAGWAFFTALVLAIASGPRMLNILHKLKFGQPIRDDGPETHLQKKGTPTMGGILILVAAAISALAWMDWSNPYVWLGLLVLGGYGAVGFVDDYKKVVQKNPAGLSAKSKYLALSLVSLLAVGTVLVFWSGTNATMLTIPFTSWTWQFPAVFFLVLGYFTTVGASNAVNLTDGLDGLCAVPVALCLAAFGFIAYVTGDSILSQNLNVLYIENAGELAVLCAAVIGGVLGFYWFNSYPAQVFMGDVGSLALGGFIGYMAVLVRQEFLLVILGGLFVLETVSVILQTGYFKYTKRKTGTGQRIFLMAPLHHHFEKKGWPETKVVARAHVFALACTALGLASVMLK